MKITYHKTNQPYAGAGEFSVEDWGVFDQVRSAKLFNQSTPLPCDTASSHLMRIESGGFDEPADAVITIIETTRR